MVFALRLEGGLRYEIHEGRFIEVLDCEGGEFLLKSPELHDESAFNRAEIELKFSGLFVHGYVDNLAEVNIDSAYQFILVWPALADEEKLNNGLPF